MSAFSRATFLASAAALDELPPASLPEIAFAGRSNVGKSSAINALANRKRLAFVSRTPGRTQTINLFDLGAAGRLADLPGYGYAKAPQALRARWDTLVGGYLARRRCLAGVVVLTDARNPLTALDLRLLDWLRPLDVPRLVLLAKCDKLAPAVQAATLARTRAALSRAGIAAPVMLFAARTGEGVPQARALLEGWLRDAGPAAWNKRPPAKGNATGGETP